MEDKIGSKPILKKHMRFLKFERENFEELVGKAIDGLPEEFQKRIENVDVVVETTPSREILKRQGIKPPGTLLGLYEGVPLKNRGTSYSSVLPDRITIYQEPIETICGTEDEIKYKIREVFIHELSHHFGTTEEDLLF